MEMKISAVLNTYNASRHLAQVLERLKCFDEIVVCDMESTDNTVAIAESYGCKVVTFPKGEYTICEPARNMAIQSASNPWVLVVDADELVPKKLADYLYEMVRSGNCPAGLFIPRKNMVLNRFLKSTYPDYQLRFLKKEGANWPTTIHSVPTVDGIVGYVPKRESLAFEHINVPVSEMITKMNLYTDNECVRRKGIRASVLKILFWPTFYFFKLYFLKGGFLLGKAGYFLAAHQANYRFYMLMKAYESKAAERTPNQNK